MKTKGHVGAMSTQTLKPPTAGVPKKGGKKGKPR